MFTLPHHLRLGGTRIWQVLICLTLLSFFCRTMIPVGYMPDLSGGQDGKVFITLCTANGGPTTMLLDLDDESSDEHAQGQECPWGMLVSQAAMPGLETPTLLGEVAAIALVPKHDNQAFPPLPALGPPLGPRAPPLNLG